MLEAVQHEDQRGFFMEVFRQQYLEERGISETFVQDNHAYSAKKGVLRGLHYQAPPGAQSKLVRVIRGAIQDVVVDIRVGSPTYAQWESQVLSGENRRQLYIPKGFAHGYVTLEDDTEVLYTVSDYNAPESCRGIAWNDHDLGVDWMLPEQEMIISEPDSKNKAFKEIEEDFRYV